MHASLLTNDDVAYVYIPALKLPGHLKGITKHHEDFVRCEDIETADAVREAMKVQWSGLVFPGWKVIVKVKDELIFAEVENCTITKDSFSSYKLYSKRGNFERRNLNSCPLKWHLTDCTPHLSYLTLHLSYSLST